MPLNPTVVHSLRRVFHEGFSVHDIAEPLVSFDSTASATEVRSIMNQNGYEVVGVREEGIIVGYLEQSELEDGTCADYTRPFDDAHVIVDAAPLSEVVWALKERPRLFVSLLGRVGGIVTRSDLQKPPVRMWLFGMVTLVEMRFTRLIERFFPDEGWKQFLTSGRMQKASGGKRVRTWPSSM